MERFGWLENDYENEIEYLMDHNLTRKQSEMVLRSTMNALMESGDTNYSAIRNGLLKLIDDYQGLR